MSLTTVDGNGSPPDGLLELHYDTVVRGFERGYVTPVLGAGASLYDRAESKGDDAWLGRYPPSAGELAAYLAAAFKIPGGAPAELLRVAQYIAALRGGTGQLYSELHDLFDRKYPVTPLHDFLAELPGSLREKGLLRKPPLILTTNYDDLVETALAAHA